MYTRRRLRIKLGSKSPQPQPAQATPAAPAAPADAAPTSTAPATQAAGPPSAAEAAAPEITFIIASYGLLPVPGDWPANNEALRAPCQRRHCLAGKRSSMLVHVCAVFAPLMIRCYIQVADRCASACASGVDCRCTSHGSCDARCLQQLRPSSNTLHGFYRHTMCTQRLYPSCNVQQSFSNSQQTGTQGIAAGVHLHLHAHQTDHTKDLNAPNQRLAAFPGVCQGARQAVAPQRSRARQRH